LGGSGDIELVAGSEGTLEIDLVESSLGVHKEGGGVSLAGFGAPKELVERIDAVESGPVADAAEMVSRNPTVDLLLKLLFEKTSMDLADGVHKVNASVVCWRSEIENTTLRNPDRSHLTPSTRFPILDDQGFEML